MALDSRTFQSDRGHYLSPPPLSPLDMTPPPSSQLPEATARRSRSQSNPYLVPAVDMEKTLCAAYGASENLPSVEEIDNVDESRLRNIAKDLLYVSQDARMSALHFKLQNSLLSFSSNEAVKRAEVEQQLARREVEILQSSEYRSRHCPSEVKRPQPNLTRELEIALRHNQELERINLTIDRRLRRSKKLIEEEREKSDLLAEEVSLLKKRIRDNREHLSGLLEHNLLSPASQVGDAQTPKRRSVHRYTSSTSPHMSRQDNDPFAALLAADKVLNRGSASVASTPCRHRLPKPQSSGHARGSHSFSSLPNTPVRSRNVHQETRYLTPVGNSRDERVSGFSEHEDYDRHDRDSTISASEAETVVSDEELPASHASSLAANMLRRDTAPGGRQEASVTTNVPRSSTLLQTKLFGQVRKPGVEFPPAASFK